MRQRQEWKSFPQGKDWNGWRGRCENEGSYINEFEAPHFFLKQNIYLY